jgi:hypothetical protein
MWEAAEHFGFPLDELLLALPDNLPELEPQEALSAAMWKKWPNALWWQVGEFLLDALLSRLLRDKKGDAVREIVEFLPPEPDDVEWV